MRGSVVSVWVSSDWWFRAEAHWTSERDLRDSAPGPCADRFHGSGTCLASVLAGSSSHGNISLAIFQIRWG